jgi:hypothetical protein
MSHLSTSLPKELPKALVIPARPLDDAVKKFISASLRFHQRQKESGKNHQAFKKTINETSKIVIDGAKVLEKVHRLDKESVDVMHLVLGFILNDDRDGFNWSTNIISLAALRKPTRAGPSKYFSAKTDMERMTKQELPTESESTEDLIQRLQGGTL